MNTTHSRRTFLSVLSASAAAMVGRAAESRAFPVNTQPYKPLMDQYYEGILNIIRGVRDTQVEKIAEAMEKAYELKTKGGTIYSNVVFGHFAPYAGCRDIPGQPWILPQYYSLLGEPFRAMKKGDFLLTNIVNMDMKTNWNEESDDWKKAHDRGVFIAGITNNYFKCFRTPPGAYYPRRMELSLEEISNLIIDSYVPWDNGLVSAPQHPRFKICPSTGIAQLAVYWACTASLAHLIGAKGKGSSAAPAKKFLDLTLERFQMIGSDRPKIDRVAEKWADLVLGRDARLFVYGEPFKAEEGLSGNMFVADAVGAANGSMIAREYSGAVRADDIVLIGSVRSNHPGELEVARAARGKGAYTVASCPFSTDGDSAGVRLFKEVDDAFTTYCDEKAGVIAIEGFPGTVCPIAGLTGNLVHWMLTAQWADHMARRGEMPYFWQGMHETGGMEYDAMVRPYFEKRGY
ncbi:MAG: hypothetical protein Q8O92_08015 [Candidatus Latescibacter sp.]|nr:hypothetical protein [Candidatus Latescibacter sp.]